VRIAYSKTNQADKFVQRFGSRALQKLIIGVEERILPSRNWGTGAVWAKGSYSKKYKITPAGELN